VLLLTINWPSKTEAWFSSLGHDLINPVNSRLYARSWVPGSVMGMTSSSSTCYVLVIGTSGARALGLAMLGSALALRISSSIVASVGSGPSGWCDSSLAGTATYGCGAIGIYKCK